MPRGARYRATISVECAILPIVVRSQMGGSQLVAQSGECRVGSLEVSVDARGCAHVRRAVETVDVLVPFLDTGKKDAAGRAVHELRTWAGPVHAEDPQDI
jgi:hypothetical protein